MSIKTLMLVHPNWLPLLLGFGASLLFSLILVPHIVRAAVRAKVVDQPNERKIHTVAIPRLGGVAIFIAFVGALGLLGLMGQSPLTGSGILGILAGGTLMFLLGLLDDFLDLSAPFKLVGQFFAASVAIGLGVSITALDLPFSKLLLLNSLSFPVTALWMVGLSNAVNFIDGMDGLAGGVSVFAALTLVMVALFTHQPEAALLAAMLAGASLGFLVYNINPARVFMGDSGALFIGFMLASIAVVGVLKTYAVVMLTPVLVLGVPVADITYSTLRRVLRGKNPMVADSDHLHHRLLKLGLTQKQVVWIFYAWCFLAGLAVSGYLRLMPYYLSLVGSLLLLTAALLLLVRRREQQALPLVAPADAVRIDAEERQP